MFGERKKRNNSSSSSASRKVSDHITTIIGEECSLEGDIFSSSSIRVDGKLNGKIEGDKSVVIGEQGKITGEIKALEAVIYGRVDGTINSNRTELKSSGMIVGDIFTNSLIVENGGKHSGRCSMDDNPTESLVVEQSD